MKHTIEFKKLAHDYQEIKKGNNQAIYVYMQHLEDIVAQYENNYCLRVDIPELRVLQRLNNNILNNVVLPPTTKNLFSNLVNKYNEFLKKVNSTKVLGHENEEPTMPRCN